MGGGVHEQGVVEAVGGGRGPARAYVNAHRHAQLLGRGVERIEVGMVEVAPGGMGRGGRGHEAEVLDAAPQLGRGLHRVLHGHQGDPLEPLGRVVAVLVEPVVVGLGHGAGVVLVLEERQAQEHGGAEVHRDGDLLQVHVLEPLHRVPHACGGLRRAVVGHRADAAANPRGLGPDTPLHEQLIAAVGFHHPGSLLLVRSLQEVLPRRELLLHVAVGIDDRKTCHGGLLPAATGTGRPVLPFRAGRAGLMRNPAGLPFPAGLRFDEKSRSDGCQPVT